MNFSEAHSTKYSHRRLKKITGRIYWKVPSFNGERIERSQPGRRSPCHPKGIEYIGEM